ncbi:MAG: ABC transporter ATP-binding protein [Lachnospiraceae bacterium]
MGASLLAVNHLSAWYRQKQEVLTGFSLELAEHEVVGLIGLNGAGKTTFLKVLSGLLPTFHSDGILFRGEAVGMRDRKFKVNRYVVFAEDNSFQYFTFREYLAYVFCAYKKEQPAQSELSALIEGFHFAAYTDVLFRDLSTGNRRKAFLITAFALKPALLLLDEPVNGLDFQSTEFLYEQMAGYREHGTLLFSSHILESITLTSDRVVVLENGRIRQTYEGGQVDATVLREALRDETNDV